MPEILNLTPEYGLNVTYEFKNDVHESLLGSDYKNARWLSPIPKFNFQVAVFTQSVQEYLKDFFLFVRGNQDIFLFDDPCNNYCTAPSPQQTVLGVQVSGVLIDVGNGNFQLAKKWELVSSGHYYYTPILYPNEITIVESNYVTPVNTAVIGNNGIVTGVNATMGWIGSFYTPVRFENDTVPLELIGANNATGEVFYQVPDLRLIGVKEDTYLQPFLASHYNHYWSLSIPINAQINLLNKTDIFVSDSGYESRDSLNVEKTELSFSYNKVNYFEQQYILGLWLLTLGGWASFKIGDNDINYDISTTFTENISFSNVVYPLSTNRVTMVLEDVLFKVDGINIKEEIEGVKTGYCQAWIIIRKDNEQLGFTNHDYSFSLNTVECSPNLGFSGTPSESTAELSTNSTELTSVFAEINEVDLLVGKYDNAEVQIYLYDWMSNQIISRQFNGSIGEYSVGFLPNKAKQYNLQVESLLEKLDVSVTAETSSECRHLFLSQGYGRCNLTPTPNNTVDANAPQILAEVSGVDNLSYIRLLSVATNNWEGFKFGIVEFVDGILQGTKVYIIDTFSPSGIALLYNLPVAPNLGDIVRLTRPCNKTVEACNNYGNIANYGGYPRLPGIDNLVSGADD